MLLSRKTPFFQMLLRTNQLLRLVALVLGNSSRYIYTPTLIITKGELWWNYG